MFAVEKECEYCKISVDMDIGAHSSGFRGVPAMTVLHYSCGCKLKCTTQKSILVTKDGKEIEL